MRGHGHARPHLLFLASGGFTERINGRNAAELRVCAGGSLRRFPAGDSHELEFGDEVTTGLLVEIDAGLEPEAGVFHGFEERAFLQSREFATRADRFARALSLAHPRPETLLLAEGWLLEVSARLDVSRREETVAIPPRCTRSMPRGRSVASTAAPLDNSYVASGSRGRRARFVPPTKRWRTSQIGAASATRAI